MKKIMILLMALVLSLSATAYDLDWTITGDVPLGASIYSCAGDSCTPGSLSLVDSGTGASQVVLDISDGDVTADDPDKYAAYLYPQDACHLATMTEIEFEDGDESFGTPWDFEKQDADHCGSEVTNPVLKVNGAERACSEIGLNRYYCGEVPPGSNLEFSAELLGAWGFPLGFAPNELKSYYQSTVDVNFSVNGAVLDSEQFDITMEEASEVKTFNYVVGSDGNYTLRIDTRMENDCKCEEREDGTRSNYKYKEVTVTIGEDNEIPEFTSLGLVTMLGLVAVFVVTRLRD